MDALQFNQVCLESELLLFLLRLSDTVLGGILLVLLEGINDKLVVSHAVAVGCRLVETRRQSLDLGFCDIYLPLHQICQLELDAQLLQLQHIALLTVLDLQSVHEYVLAKDMDTDAVNLHLGLQVVL